MIEHIVISGGGITGIFSHYGFFRKMFQENLWSFDHLKSIYGTSAGSIVGTFLLMQYQDFRHFPTEDENNYPWKILDDFLILRPWEKVIVPQMSHLTNIMGTWTKCGVFDRTMFEDALRPLFAACNLPITVTLKEFHEWAGAAIDFHLFCVDVISFQSIDMSHATHPDLPLLDAIYRSCSIPLVFQPQKDETHIYVDGCVLSHFPLMRCLEDTGCAGDQVLGLCTGSSAQHNQCITNAADIENMGQLVHLMCVNGFVQLNGKFAVPSEKLPLPHVHFANMNCPNSIDHIFSFLHSPELRRQLIDNGIVF